jgi:hypothetical protein
MELTAFSSKPKLEVVCVGYNGVLAVKEKV